MNDMIEMRVADIEGDLLDCLVAVVLNPEEKIFFNADGYTLRWHRKPPPYSSDWAHGGPLLDKFRPSVEASALQQQVWACIYGTSPTPHLKSRGETYLTAVCRAVVVANRGDVVLVPPRAQQESKA